MTGPPLIPVEYAGTDLTAANTNFRAYAFPTTGPSLVPAIFEQRLVPVAGSWPRHSRSQPTAKILAFEIELLGDVTQDAIDELLTTFDPEQGEQSLILSDGTLEWEYLASVTGIEHDDVQRWWTVTFQAAFGYARKRYASESSATIAATTATIPVINQGNRKTPVVLEVTPSAVKGVAADQRYRSQINVAWRAPRAAYRYPIAITLDTVTEVTATRMLASGNDLRVLVDGREIQRDLGSMNNAATRIWISLDFGRERSGALPAAITDVSPATGETLTLDDASQLPPNGVGVMDDEPISWSLKSGNTLLGISRGVRNGVAASHSAGARLYLIEHQIDVVWGSTSATAPTIDSDQTPMFDLATGSSSNVQWTYSNFATLDGLRPAEWVPTLIGTNTRMLALRGAYTTSDTLPTADNGNHNNGTATGAAGRFNCVDDAVGAPNDDTDYLNFTAAGKQSFVSAPTALPAGSVIGSLTITWRAKYITTSGTMRSMFRINSTDYVAGTTENLTASYVNYARVWTTNPATGLPWTAMDIASIEWGVDVFTAVTAVRVTQMYLTVAYVPDNNPAAEIGVFIGAATVTMGKPNQDAWVLATPCGAKGAAGLTMVVANGATAPGTAARIYSQDAYGQEVEAGNDVGTQVISPDFPAYQLQFRLVTASSTVFLGMSASSAIVKFDSTATPHIVNGAREDTYIARFTLTNGALDPAQSIGVLFPMKIGETLTIDAEALTAEYSLPGYNPIAAIGVDAPRRHWLELAPGYNGLAFSDTTHGAGSVGISILHRDRKA